MPAADVANQLLPQKIGITGGIGAGKSTACKVFACLGVPIYYADDRAKWLMENDSKLVYAIGEQFGKESYTSERQLNRVYLAERVFGNEAELEKLNGLVHPAVGKDWDSWAARQNAPYVLKEAALLFEAGSYQTLDATIVVTAPKDVRINRTLMRDAHRSRVQVEDIIDRQWKESKKIKLANYQLINDDKHLMLPQILALHQKLSNV
jgi:dephospho-CoA kinase